MRPGLDAYTQALGALRAPRGGSLRPAALDAALGLLAEARGAGHAPDAAVYRMLFALAAQAGQGAAALQLQAVRPRALLVGPQCRGGGVVTRHCHWSESDVVATGR